ncbi:hypothetical protein BKA63DRAFT_209932 [Paraphoma chrysanthemicola]|nr:hypothetical protein BKA63DRAFT_209932 [Paraphoma chrysanthemicola]
MSSLDFQFSSHLSITQIANAIFVDIADTLISETETNPAKQAKVSFAFIGCTRRERNKAESVRRFKVYLEYYSTIRTIYKAHDGRSDKFTETVAKSPTKHRLQIVSGSHHASATCTSARASGARCRAACRIRIGERTHVHYSAGDAPQNLNLDNISVLRQLLFHVPCGADANWCSGETCGRCVLTCFTCAARLRQFLCIWRRTACLGRISR